MEPGFEVNMNDFLPLRDVVFNTLRQAILRGELKPGERLMEIKLANKLGVSRTPIREAIRKLELEGLVLIIPRRRRGCSDHGKKPPGRAGGAALTGSTGSPACMRADAGTGAAGSEKCGRGF